MRFGIFPKNRSLLTLAVCLYFALSTQIYYSLLPQFTAFSEAYRWPDFDRFARLWLIVFWIFLALALVMDSIQESNRIRAIGDSNRRDTTIIFVPVILILPGLFQIGARLTGASNIIELYQISTNPLLLLLGGLVATGAIFKFRSYSERRALARLREDQLANSQPPPEDDSTHP